MSVKGTKERPEIAALRARIATLPDGWVDEGFVAAMTRRVEVSELLRQVDERIAAAQARAQVAGDEIHATSEWIDEACSALTQLGVLEHLREKLAPLPAGVANDLRTRPALDRANGALTAALKNAVDPLAELDFERELAEWRKVCGETGLVLDPPLPSDADRETARLRGEFAARWDKASIAHREWQLDASTHGATADPLDLLGSAAGQLSAIEAMREEIAPLSRKIVSANQHRKKAGLTWSAERAAFAYQQRSST